MMMKTKRYSLFICILLALTLVCGCAAGVRQKLTSLIIHRETPYKDSPRALAYSHALAATIYENQGKFDKAREETRKAAELVPDSPILTMRLIRGYLRDEDYTNALTMAEKAIGQLPNNANLWIVLGEIYHQLDRFDDAVAAFQKAITIDPANILGYGALVSIEENTNDLIAATDIYERLLKLTPNASRIHYQLGLCYAKMNDPARARTSLEKALQLNPDLTHAHYVLGLLAFDTNDNETARHQYEQYLEKKPEDLRARENLAGALAQLNKTDEAIDQLAQVAADEQADPRTQIELMYLLLRAGKHKELEDAAPPTQGPLLGSLFRALARKANGEPYKPILESLDATEGDINNECDLFLSDLLYLFGKEPTATFLTESLTDARTKGLHSKTIDFLLARTLMTIEKYDEAHTLLTNALEKHGDDKNIHHALAIVCENLKMIDETEHHLKAYLQISPDDPEVLNFLGYFYADHNLKLDEAEKLLKRALEIDPKNGYYMDSLGWVYYRKGDADHAIELIRNAIIAMDNDDAELRNHLGDAYLLKGDTDHALAEWHRALRLDPKLEGVTEKIKEHDKPKAE